MKRKKKENTQKKKKKKKEKNICYVFITPIYLSSCLVKKEHVISQLVS